MYSVFCVVPCADVTFIGYFLIYAVTKSRMTSGTTFFINHNIVLDFGFILEFACTIFVLLGSELINFVALF